MPSSQHQQISSVVSFVMNINPNSILEIGVGFGKYGVLCREYLEYWKGDVDWKLPVKENWERRIDGIEAFEDYINTHHKYIYSNLYIGDALDVIDTLDTKYDLVMLIDVLEHFNYEDGMVLLEKCLKKSKNILISIPKDIGLQSDVNDNAYEIHRFQFLKKHFKKLNTNFAFASGGTESLIVLLGNNAKKYYYRKTLHEWVTWVKESLPGFWIRRRYITKKLSKKNK